MIPVDVFAGREVAVFGLARSGAPAVRALVAGGAKVAAWDEDPATRARLAAEGLPIVDLDGADWRGFGALVLAPGAPLDHPAPHWTVRRAREAGVEIVGDVELFARAVAAAPPHRRPKVVAITGTNGKSTTTALIGHVVRAAGRDGHVGGNIGVGVLDLPDMHGGAIYVLELSSYQLELTSSLRPDVAVLLNISPDHLDRHGGMDGYVAAKRRVLLNQGVGDTAVIGVDDPWCQRICTEITAANRRAIAPISAGKCVGKGVFALKGALYDALEGAARPVGNLNAAPALTGRHNWQNAAAAYAAARALGLSSAAAVEGLMSFGGLAHRMEPLGSLGEVRFVNNSKATNIAAARQAMASFPRFRWIAGGRPKGESFGELGDLLGGVEKAYLIGEAAPQLAEMLDGRAPRQCFASLGEAVRAAHADALAAGGPDVVLFSPACASFDQFTDFEARGEAFRAAVEALVETLNEDRA